MNLRDCIELQEFPKGITKLISLRHLIISTRQSDFLDKEIEKLISLETLAFYSCHNLESLLFGIQHSSLKILFFSNCGGLKSLSFHVVKNLESLIITDGHKLELSMGLGNQIPNSGLNLICLEGLPQLVTLPQWLQGSMNTLHSLLIIDFKNLEELPEWLSTLICLKQLRIVLCPKLLSLPGNMHHQNLEHLEIFNCPELCKRYQPKVGQDWHKISHIKEVFMGEIEEENDFAD